MRYVFQESYYNAEFDFHVERGAECHDGDIEPDLIAQLVSRGILESDQPKPIQEVKRTVRRATRKERE